MSQKLFDFLNGVDPYFAKDLNELHDYAVKQFKEAEKDGNQVLYDRWNDIVQSIEFCRSDIRIILMSDLEESFMTEMSTDRNNPSWLIEKQGDDQNNPYRKILKKLYAISPIKEGYDDKNKVG